MKALIFAILTACDTTEAPQLPDQAKLLVLQRQVEELSQRVQALVDQEVIMVSRLDATIIGLDNCRRDRR